MRVRCPSDAIDVGPSGGERGRAARKDNRMSSPGLSPPGHRGEEFPAGGKHVETNAATARRDTARPCLPVLLNSTEVADLLRTTRKAVYAMVERGQIPGVVRLGRRVLFRQQALLHWLRQKSSPSLER